MSKITKKGSKPQVKVYNQIRLNLVDGYTRRGNRLKSDHGQIIISQRSNPKGRKAEYYIIYIPTGSKDRYYISSLYPHYHDDDRQIYKFEFRGYEYYLTLKLDEAFISDFNQTSYV